MSGIVQGSDKVRARALLPLLLPIVAILLARWASQLPLAQDYPRATALLFLWVAADSLTLALIAKSRPAAPPARRVLASLAFASLIVVIGSTTTVRQALFGMTLVATMMAIVLVVHVGWGLHAAARKFHEARSLGANGWDAAMSEFMPPTMLRMVRAEWTMLSLALFRWRVQPDVPPGTVASRYDQHLAPMMIVMLILQMIEIGVVHLVVGLWSTTAALILLAISLTALVYFVGLVKSFRYLPVLVTPDVIHVRTGLLIDHSIPFTNVAEIIAEPSGDLVRSAGTRNVGLIAWPNIMIRLSEAVERATLFGPREMKAIAFRVDDPAAFLSAVAMRRPAP